MLYNAVMSCDYKIYLICYFAGRPLDFRLPVYTDAQFADVVECAGTCFKIYDPNGAEILLACHKNGETYTERIKIEGACKANANISFCVVVNEADNSGFLRAYTDETHNALYPLPNYFIKSARA